MRVEIRKTIVSALTNVMSGTTQKNIEDAFANIFENSTMENQWIVYGLLGKQLKEQQFIKILNRLKQCATFKKEKRIQQCLACLCDYVNEKIQFMQFSRRVFFQINDIFQQEKIIQAIFQYQKLAKAIYQQSIVQVPHSIYQEIEKTKQDLRSKTVQFIFGRNVQLKKTKETKGNNKISGSVMRQIFIYLYKYLKQQKEIKQVIDDFGKLYSCYYKGKQFQFSNGYPYSKIHVFFLITVINKSIESQKQKPIQFLKGLIVSLKVNCKDKFATSLRKRIQLERVVYIIINNVFLGYPNLAMLYTQIYLDINEFEEDSITSKGMNSVMKNISSNTQLKSKYPEIFKALMSLRATIEKNPKRQRTRVKTKSRNKTKEKKKNEITIMELLNEI